MDKLLSELVEKLQKAHGSSLVSAVLYGSGATAGDKDKFSDLNVLCVLKEINSTELKAAEPVFRWWREMGNPAPLLLSEDEVRTSTDCFPIEFHDIKERNRLLAGKDVVSDLVIDYSFYRAQVEHELRAKLLRLRQKAGGVLSDGELLVRMMADSLSTFCVLFRHALILAGESPVFGKREIIEAASAKFGVPTDSFLSLLEVREGGRKTKDVRPESLFEQYLSSLQTVVNAVDRMQK